MTEYRMTDGRAVVIETARTEQIARESAARRLGCLPDAVKTIETKRKPKTEREKKQDAYWGKYADWLLRVQKGKKSVPPIGNGGNIPQSERDKTKISDT